MRSLTGGKIMRQKERIPQLDIFRAIAIFAVLAIHATSRTLAETLGTNMFHPFLFINKFSQFAVPSFIFLSGFVLFYNYIDRPLGGKTLGKFYTRRLLYIIVPYVVFSLLYFALKMNAGNTWGLPPGRWLLSYGSIYGQERHIRICIILLSLFSFTCYFRSFCGVCKRFVIWRLGRR